MMMIPSIEILEDGDTIGIPIFGTDEFCWVTWLEGEDCNDFFLRATGENYVCPWSSFSVWSSLNQVREHPDYKIFVYDIFCYRTHRKFHLISYDDVNDFDDLSNCVCLPFNRLNLLKFYKEYVLPFAEKQFE